MELEELRKLQKIEAEERLKLLQKQFKLYPNVLREFIEDETIYYSERINNVFDGVLYWLSNKPEFVEAVKEIEDKYNLYVYHCILSHTEFGDCLAMLYVSKEPDLWKEEKSSLIEGLPLAYVYDFNSYGSEFGYIEIAGANGGLTRVN